MVDLSQPFMCSSSWQKLLLCTDGSPRSQGAIKATLALAQVCGHKVYVVNVLRMRAEACCLPKPSLIGEPAIIPDISGKRRCLRYPR
jgi:hypothetical protein